MLLICGLLVNGTASSAVPANIQTTSTAFTGKEATELTLVSFVHDCRGVLEGLNQMLLGYRLGKARSWHQLFKDGISLRKIAFQNLVIDLMEGDKLDPVIVLSCMFLKDETSDNQVVAILDMVSDAMWRLQWGHGASNLGLSAFL